MTFPFILKKLNHRGTDDTEEFFIGFLSFLRELCAFVVKFKI